MIAKLRGLVDRLGEDFAVIDVQGVGYLVFASSRTLGRLPEIGKAASLEIETHVREDHIHLYGFIDQSERDWFRLLTTVQGVGAKVALAILSALSPEKIAQAIAAGDKAALSRANGVGPKLAQRIAAELKDKAGKIALAPFAAEKGGKAQAAAAPDGSGEAVSALVNLGYGASDAFAAVARAAQELGEGAKAEALIRASLKELGRNQAGRA